MEVKQFDKYSLLDYMGKGGMASVYRASHNEDGSIVAVKIFESNEDRPPEMSRKLRDREVRMLVSVQHPNIVKFRESGQVGEDYYYAMEFVENSLRKCIRRGTEFTLVEKVLILRQTVSALAAIHHQGVVHRDIKPGNILLDQDPNDAIHVKLTDLGIAKNVSETDIVREQMPTRVPGTAKYLCPEQIRLQAVDGRADVFSLGVVAYELMTGASPFEADTTEGFLAANREQRQVPAHQLSEDVPPFLGEMIERMLAKDREERYDSDTLSRDLELVQQHLISGAPMVELTNPASMFYEPPAAEPEEMAEWRPGRAVEPAAWAVALAIVLVGVVLSVVLWPEAVRPPEPKPAPTATERLKEAAAAADAGLYWRALMVVRDLDGDQVPVAARSRLESLSARVQEALAQDSYASAQAMLSLERKPEAEIMLLRMQEFLPDARLTRELEAALHKEERRASPEEEWEQALLDTYALVRRRRYREALDARKKLLERVPGQSEKDPVARRAIGDLFDQWTRYLLQSYPQAEEIEDFFAAAEAHRDLVAGRLEAGLEGELHLKLAQVYRDEGDYDGALAQYGLAAGETAGDVATRARKERDELVKWMADRSHEALAFGRELERSGFAGGLWRVHNDPGGSQQVLDGVLVVRARGQGERTVVQRETVRPVRNLGFTVGVKFQAPADMLSRPGSAQIGLAVTGTKGSVFELAFDGGSYLVAITGRSGQVSAGGAVGKALGDEDRAWHELALRYNFNTGQLAVLLDDEELRRYAIDLADFRIRVSLTASAGVAARAEFKDIFCRP